MSGTSNAALAEPWKQLWNGDLTVTDKVIADDFVAHAAPLTGTGSDLMHGREEHRHIAHRRRRASRVLGQCRQPALLPATRHP
jgi:hypothetical protein